MYDDDSWEPTGLRPSVDYAIAALLGCGSACIGLTVFGLLVWALVAWL